MDRPTDQPTDIATYRAAIAAKKTYRMKPLHEAILGKGMLLASFARLKQQ